MKFAAMMGAASAHELLSATEYKFMSFITEHGRSYATKAEYDFRLNQFAVRVAEHERWNAIPGQTSEQGVNFLTDRTDDEIKYMNGYKREMTPKNVTKVESTDAAFNVEANAAIDWRTKGAVTPVKNQGHCGSCWSFSTTGSMEGAHQISTGNLVSLSESNLVDCSWLNHGCNGGNVALAYEYAEGHPLETEADYPYHATSGLFDCKYDKSKGVIKVTTWHMVGRDSAQGFYTALQTGPVSVAVEADKPVFHQYTKGIITDAAACGTSLDHAILVVGYGAEGTQAYWIVKNSWTTAWGESGYVRIGVADGGGVCGIQEEPFQPVTN